MCIRDSPYHLVAAQHELCIVLVVAAALYARVLAAVDLQHEPFPDKKVDAMAMNPGLRHDSQLQPGQSCAHVAFKARICEAIAGKKHRFCLSLIHI